MKYKLIILLLIFIILLCWLSGDMVEGFGKGRGLGGSGFALNSEQTLAVRLVFIITLVILLFYL
jgi:hypothetical protein